MKPKDIFLTKLRRGHAPRMAIGSATSIVTTDLMAKLGIFFPDAHLEPGKMAKLAAAGHTELGFDNVMPLFSVWHESSAIGCPDRESQDNGRDGQDIVCGPAPEHGALKCV